MIENSILKAHKSGRKAGKLVTSDIFSTVDIDELMLGPARELVNKIKNETIS